jgi:hypothetical protein
MRPVVVEKESKSDLLNDALEPCLLGLECHGPVLLWDQACQDTVIESWIPCKHPIDHAPSIDFADERGNESHLGERCEEVFLIFRVTTVALGTRVNGRQILRIWAFKKAARDDVVSRCRGRSTIDA